MCVCVYACQMRSCRQGVYVCIYISVYVYVLYVGFVSLAGD